jgi:GT2 family glycosyltransferase
MPTHATPRHAILIAGMHRSGTSALARVLNLLGADIGTGLLPGRTDNPRGYWEAEAVVALNEECLAHHGRSWHDPRPLPEGWMETPWTQQWRERLRALIAERYAGTPLLLVKDPRIARLLQAWLEELRALGITPHVIITLRHPDEVAASLGKRKHQPLPPAHSRLLWMAHLLDAESASRGVSRAFVSYNRLLDDWRETARGLATRFAIEWPQAPEQTAADIDAFLLRDLRHHQAQQSVVDHRDVLAQHAAALYTRMIEGDPQSDDMRTEFDRQCRRLEDGLIFADALRNEAASESAKDESVASMSGELAELWQPAELVPIEARLYSRRADGEYRESQALAVQLPASASAQRVDFALRSDGCTLFRFDPAEVSGIYRILALHLDGDPVDPADYDVRALHDIRLKEEDSEILRFHCSDTDPWVEFDLERLLHKRPGARTLGFTFQRDSIPDILRRENASLRRMITTQDETLACERAVLHARIGNLQMQLEDRLQRLYVDLQQNTSVTAETRAALERLRQGEYFNVLALHAASADRRSPPRGGLRLQARPVQHLRRLATHLSVTLQAWSSEGDDPQFDLRWPGQQPLSTGWYVLRLDMQSVRGDLPPPRLYVDYGDGFDDADAVAVALTPGSLRQRPLLRFARPTHALRLDPATDNGHGDFLFDEVISLRRISSAEALLRLGLPAARRMRAQGKGWRSILGESRAVLRHGGKAALETLHANAQATAPTKGGNDYAAWIAAHDTLDDAARAAIRERIAAMPSPPSISILLPVYNTPERWLRRCLDSVLAQLYPHWELCIADDASTEPHVRRVLDKYTARDPRIKVVHRAENGHISAASNSALELANGGWIALLDHDDELPEHALYHAARAILERPDAALIYSDEDKITEDGTRFDPYFKPDWNPELFRGHNMVSHLGIYRHELVQQVGGFREGYEGSQDYDLALRCIERIRREQIVHIPRVLYHWRAIRGSTAFGPQEKDYAHSAARRAIAEHLARSGVDAEVLPIEHRAGNWRVRRALPQPAPRVSIIIPTRNGGEVLRRCIDSIDSHTTYANRKIHVVDNRSDRRDTLDYLDTLRKRRGFAVTAFDEPFNFSRLNNCAARGSDGEVLLFLNDDTEVITPNWLEELVALAVSTGVGASGAMLYYPDGSIQHAGIVLGLGADRIAGHAYHRMPRGTPGDKCRAQLVQEVSAVTAACMAIRRDRFDDVGGFDEELAVAFNDVDLCLRLADRGLHNVWTPNTELYHHESHTRGADTDPQRRAEYLRECEFMRARWGDRLLADPYYHPALSLDRGDFTTFDTPRAEALHGSR